jgi:acyl dehydratase
VTSGPFFDDLHIGQTFTPISPTRLTPALAAAHQSIVGNWLPLAHPGPARDAGLDRPLASPSLVWDVSIGHSTGATREVIANLFYRGLAFHRLPRTDDELVTLTQVVALRSNRPREGRDLTGMALLRVTTHDQQGRLVLDFMRCAMLPAQRLVDDQGDWEAQTLAPPPPERLCDWPAQDREGGSSAGSGSRAVSGDADVVSCAPELARLTLNVARVHHDSRRSGRRLVYGGHTIGLAFSQACRALPEIIAPVAWVTCSHTAPVFEGDTVTTEHHVVEEAGATGTRTLHVHTKAYALREGDERHLVLEWEWKALHH